MWGARENGSGCQLVSLHIKGMLPAESLAIFNNWLALGWGAASPQPERFLKMSTHHNTQKIKNIYNIVFKYVYSCSIFSILCIRVGAYWEMRVGVRMGKKGAIRQTRGPTHISDDHVLRNEE